jgi:hypothetical protein
MPRIAHAVATVSMVLAACALSLGCGKTCMCHGDVCTDCSGTTSTAPAPDTGTPEAGDPTTESSVTLGCDFDAAACPSACDSRCIDAGGSDSGSSAPDNQAGGPDSGSSVDAGSAHDSGGGSDGGAECITGCSRGTTACMAPDPPVGWSCSGPGISSGGRFLDAGCTSVPINSIAWCCPDTFMSQCVCTPGQDWTCNDNPAISSIHGVCLPDHSCSCSAGSLLNPATGRCKP